MNAHFPQQQPIIVFAIAWRAVGASGYGFHHINAQTTGPARTCQGCAARLDKEYGSEDLGIDGSHAAHCDLGKHNAPHQTNIAIDHSRTRRQYPQSDSKTLQKNAHFDRKIFATPESLLKTAVERQNRSHRGRRGPRRATENTRDY